MKIQKLEDILKLFDNGDFVLFKWKNEPNWPVEFVSSNVINIFGYSVGEFENGDVRYADIIHKDDLNRVIEEVSTNSTDNKKEFIHEPYRVKKRDGSHIWLYDSTKILRDRDGNITHYIGYIVDITYHKKKEEEIAKLKDRYEFAIAGSNDGIWDWDLVTNKIYFSTRWKNMLGYSEDEIGDSLSEWSDRVHPDDIEGAKADVTKHLNGESLLYENIHRVKHKNGNYLWILDRGKALFDENGKAYRMVGFHSDITKQKELETKLYELNENLQNEVNRQVKEIRAKDELLIQQSKIIAMSEMITNIAHQWRQPLNTVGLILQKFEFAYFRKSLTKEFISDNVSKGMELVHKMSKTIDDFRNFFQPKETKLKFHISEVIDNSITLVKEFYTQNSINIIVNLHSDIEIYGYKSEFSQVILNILNNAKDALIEKKIKNPIITIDVFKMKNNLTINIKDNGGGVDKRIIDRIFEPYFTTKEQGKGIGVGLYMAKMVIENSMHGKIYVKNGKEGASFIIELPFTP